MLTYTTGRNKQTSTTGYGGLAYGECRAGEIACRGKKVEQEEFEAKAEGTTAHVNGK